MNVDTDALVEGMRFELAQVETCWNHYNDRGAQKHALLLASRYKDLEQALAAGAPLPTQWTEGR